MKKPKLLESEDKNENIMPITHAFTFLIISFNFRTIFVINYKAD